LTRHCVPLGQIVPPHVAVWENTQHPFWQLPCDEPDVHDAPLAPAQVAEHATH
jgi:hypothetical protein